jgi:uncharacterized protein (TIGR02246 family)
MLLLALAATAAGLPSPPPARTAAAQNPSKDERAIRAVAARWQQDWNRHDYKALGDLLAVDGDYITDAGVWLRGRQEFVDWHAKHPQMYRDSSWTNNELTLRFLQPEIAILHLTWGVKGDLDAKGAPLPGRPGISTWLLVKISGHWKIRSAQDTGQR